MLTVSVLTMSPSQFPFTASERNSSMGPVSPSSFSGAKQKAESKNIDVNPSVHTKRITDKGAQALRLAASGNHLMVVGE